MDAPLLMTWVARVARAAAFVLAAALAAALAFALLPETAHADVGGVAAPSGLGAELEQQVRTLAADGAATAPAGVERVEVVVGRLDPRLHLAPCQRIEPYLPNGTRLWGHGRIGLRCVEGPSPWNVYLPITVRAWGRGLVATTGATTGSTLTVADVTEGEVDLAEEQSPAAIEPEQVVGRTLARPLRPGQSVRLAHLKPRQWFSAGDLVKVVAAGRGFSLESEGQALSNGIEGQPARVRTANGRVLTGRPTGSGRVDLAL